MSTHHHFLRHFLSPLICIVSMHTWGKACLLLSRFPSLYKFLTCILMIHMQISLHTQMKDIGLIQILPWKLNDPAKNYLWMVKCRCSLTCKYRLISEDWTTSAFNTQVTLSFVCNDEPISYKIYTVFWSYNVVLSHKEASAITMFLVSLAGILMWCQLLKGFRLLRHQLTFILGIDRAVTA